jgi:pseudaminic acid synthase
MKIADREISLAQPPYIIAELSANHNGSLERAMDIVRAAKQAGASAVKLQTYRPDTITLDSDRPEFMIHGGLWNGKRLFDLYQWAHMPWDWHQPLFSLAKELGITIFSSPFDFTAIDLLAELDAPAYKIASFEAIDLPLIRYAAETQKPLIISTGMANEAEIDAALNTAHKYGCGDVALLHCVSGYPAPAEEYNLRTIPHMRQFFGCEIGLSDHTIGNTTAITATAIGASLIEKHFTLSRADGGPDSAFSLEPAELTQLVNDSKTAWASLGTVNYTPTPAEKQNVQFRRSLYLVKAVRNGDILTKEHIRSVRPGLGLPPSQYENVLGRKVTHDQPANVPLSWEWLETK